MEISTDKLDILEHLKKNTVTIINGEAGTGKTLIGSLGGQKLLENSKEWKKVLYLTYSKFAKRQIINTIKKLKEKNHLKPEYVKRMDVMNYHSFWWNLITEHYCFLGLNKKPIISTRKELKEFAAAFISQIPKKILPNGLLNKDGTINKKKKNRIEELFSGLGALYCQFGAEHFGRNAEDFIGAQALLEWCQEQIFERNRSGFFSHEETVCWAYKLLSLHPNLLSLIRDKYSVFIFDEFQDTDIAQWEIIKLLAPKTILVLADSAQTIHHWRGADPERMNQLKKYCEEKAIYQKIENHKLISQHRSHKNMSEPQNISWESFGNMINQGNAIEFNGLKKYAKIKCKNLCKKIFRKDKTIAILCLTNKLTDEITEFFRTRQEFDKFPLPPFKCTRYGSNYSPFETARNIIFQLLIKIENCSPEEVQEYLANAVFGEIFFHKLERCSSRSRRDDLEKRWELAVKLKEFFTKDFGDGLIKLKEFIRYIEGKLGSYCDRRILGVFYRVGISIQRMGIKEWKSLTLEDKRIKVDSVILQYEEAVAISRKDNIYIMTVHQAKGQEFDNVIVFWFSTIPWDKSAGYAWNMDDEEHINLFHTACTRARDQVFVMAPKYFTPRWPPGNIRGLLF